MNHDEIITLIRAATVTSENIFEHQHGTCTWFSICGCPTWTMGYCISDDGSVTIMPDIFDEFGDADDIRTMRDVCAMLKDKGVVVKEAYENDE